MRRFFNKYVSEITCILVGFYLFAVVYAFAVDIDKKVIDVLNSIGVFLSSGGAIVAFITLLNVVLSKRNDQEDKEVEYSNFILIILDRQYRYLKMVIHEIKIQQDTFKFTSPIDQALAIQFPEFDDKLVMPIKLEKTMFLLSTDYPDIVRLLDDCQRDFMYLAGNTSYRNDLFINNYQKVVQHHLKQGQEFKQKDIEGQIGTAVIPSLVAATNNILDRIDILNEQILDTHIKLLKLLRAKYPDRKFIIPIEIQSD